MSIRHDAVSDWGSPESPNWVPADERPPLLLGPHGGVAVVAMLLLGIVAIIIMFGGTFTR
ncbi:hypothetical protein [Gordonia rhizosphera]|uniref:Uncharacterized protein n=1 Tax=Gordonia rhizosphera NBRC 16068 TaxID=1108045 RepID=K6UYD5_9ACTN|nr:hypothetical protein [Gordonia rhizosphera]GAB88438.1 hypothetical protein GORHZ_022_00100 [Gordonia rhizosphera NBRC 16068]